MQHSQTLLVCQQTFSSRQVALFILINSGLCEWICPELLGNSVLQDIQMHEADRWVMPIFGTVLSGLVLHDVTVILTFETVAD